MQESIEIPQQVLYAHLQAIRSGNLVTLMQDYTEDSVFITQAGSFTGLSEIKGEFERLLAAFPPGSTFNLLQQTIVGNYIFLVWSGESAFLKIPFATDTFLIQDNKIALQTFAGQMLVKTT